MVLLLGGLAVYWINPAEGGIFPSCFLHEWTGLLCPGCGTTRSLHQLLHGNLWAAFCLNPLLISFMPLLVVAVVRNYQQNRTLWPLAISAKTGYVLAVVVIGYGVLRNLPIYPFLWLAPHLP